MTPNLERYDGYLFSKLHLIGSKSEGPTYYLQKFDYKEFVVQKKVNLWENDPKLDEFLAKKVTIEGILNNNRIEYEALNDYTAPSGKPEEKLEVELKLSEDKLEINKKPPGTYPTQCLGLILRVKWPYRGIWEGCCPTSQLYEITIEFLDKIIWRWSENKFFAQAFTPIQLIGGRYYEFKENWIINPDDLVSEGSYTARALFIASAHEVTENFEIIFV
jgi:hypothetical protein